MKIGHAVSEEFDNNHYDMKIVYIGRYSSGDHLLTKGDGILTISLEGT